MRDRLQDGTQRLNSDSHIQQVSGEEEIVIIAKNRKDKIPQRVQEGIVCDGNSSLPDLKQQMHD